MACASRYARFAWDDKTMHGLLWNLESAANVDRLCICGAMLITASLQRLPNSAAGPSYKLTLPHQVVHKYMLHLVDADIELASHAEAKQVWHGSIAPRRNKERSEYTLQVRSWAFPRYRP